MTTRVRLEHPKMTTRVRLENPNDDVHFLTGDEIFMVRENNSVFTFISSARCSRRLIRHIFFRIFTQNGAGFSPMWVIYFFGESP